jgi:hypothetical protein
MRRCAHLFHDDPTREKIGSVNGEIDLNNIDLSREVEVDGGEEQIFAKYNERFQPREYRQVFYPVSGQGQIDALFPEGFFESAKLILKGVTSKELRQGIEGVVAVFLCRHYLELAIKYTLFHSRWLKDSKANAIASDVEPVGKGHDLQYLWDTLTEELKGKPSVVPTGLDLDFVGDFIKEFHAVDRYNTRFRYPGKQLPVQPSSNETLNIDFDSLLFNLQRAYDVLDTLDRHLIETFGENEEWEAIQNSW